MDRFDDLNNNSNNDPNSLDRIKELDKMKKYGKVEEYGVFGDNEQIKMFMGDSNNNIKEEESKLEQSNSVEEEQISSEEVLENGIENNKTEENKEESTEEKTDGISEKKYENKADELIDKVKNIKPMDVWNKLTGKKSEGEEEDDDEVQELERLGMSVARVMTVYLTLFILLIGYISYFQIFKAPRIADKETNPRVLAKRNETLRGPIYDRNNQVIAESEKKGKLSQIRKYPYNDLYAHPIGYSDDRYGRTELERYYDKHLREDNVPFTFEGVISKLKSIGTSNDGPKTGNSVVTSLDTKVQKVAYDALGNNKGAVVVLNPKTGEVLASVSKPAFNPNDLEKEMNDINTGKVKKEDKPLIDRANYELYPPGSTFKVVTLSSAYENISGISSRMFNDQGTMVVGNATLSNQSKVKFGNIDVKQALVKSSNIVFGTLALDLGNGKLKATAEEFGFNSTIPAEGININKSGFPTIGAGRDGEIAQSGIGQGAVVATPMQMALVASTVANGGIMMQPKLVNEVKNQAGDTVLTVDAKEYKTVLKGDIASKVKSDMVGVVNGNGATRASFSDLKAINAGGKTGTADYMIDKKTDGNPHAWFIGFAPAENPQVAIAVIVEAGGGGGDVAAPVAGKVMRTALGK